MELEKYTVKQLRTLASKSNISLHGLSRKTDIIDRLAKYYGNKDKPSCTLPQRFTINSLLKPLQSTDLLPQKLTTGGDTILEPIKKEQIPHTTKIIRKEPTATLADQPFAIQRKGFSAPTERLPIISKDNIANIDLVSNELLEEMFLNSDLPTLESLCKVNSKIYNLCQNDSLWHTKFLNDFGSNINNVSSWSLAYHNYYYLNNPSYGYLFIITGELPTSVMFLVDKKRDMYQQLINIYDLGLNKNPLYNFLSQLINPGENNSEQLSINKMKTLVKASKSCRIEKITLF